MEVDSLRQNSPLTTTKGPFTNDAMHLGFREEGFSKVDSR